MEDLKRIERSALQRIKSAASAQDVAVIRSEILGKKGSLGGLMRSLGELTADERPKVGQQINAVKEKIEQALLQAVERIDGAARDHELEAGFFDVTLPGRRVRPGVPHRLRAVEDEIIQALAPLGFSVAEGPHAEHDWYNFEALNIPEDHPARDMQDTFFLAPRVVLRTHTSNVQIRTMVKREPPVRVLAPGMVFRKDDVDPTHSPVFHQIEGLWIDEHASFGDLKGVLRRIAVQLFGAETEVRFRPSFFPFTEPSLEMDVKNPKVAGGGMGWLEILGAGMVHPAVLRAVGYDPEKVQGFAFGLGIERVAMLKWGIDDIRAFYENDVRFLHQFQSSAAR